MHQHAARRSASTVFALGIALALASPPSRLAAQSAPRQAAAQSAPKSEKPAPKSEKPAPQPGKSEQAIVVLVNDEPITAYEIQQRTGFLVLNSGSGPDLKAKAEARWAQIVKDPRTNERLQALFREKNVKSREEAQAIQKEYASKLQINMLEQLKREARDGMLPKFKKEAQEELIEERLKLQEAKRQGIEITDEEVKRVLKDLAERNKMTEDQFVQNLKAGGVDVSTLRERFRAQFAWREVVRRRGQMLVSINQRDVEQMITASAREAGDDTVELQVQKITLLAPAKDQSTMARRYAEAEALQRRYGGCTTMAGLAKEAGDARHEDLKYIKPSSLPEPTRSLLLSAKDGDMLPPATAAQGIEVYAVCGRRPIKLDEKEREKAEGALAQKEFEIVGKRYLRDLRQDAHIEYR
jgi:peptidyl-prolyl cis-trans isomerase SurA